jgi:glycosyltransferase involved in cell wall biosynthesis
MDRPARADVLFLLNSLELGGSESKIVRLANSLAERGLKVAVAYLSGPETLKAEVSPQVSVVPLHRRGKFSLGAAARLVKAIRHHDTKVLVTVNLYPALYGSIARLRFGRKRLRWIASLNTTDVMNSDMERRMRLYGPILRRADSILFGAQTQARLWREKYRIGAPPVTTDVLYNGVDLKRFDARTQSGTPRSHAPRTRYVVGAVGRLHPEKAHTDLVKAIAMLRARGVDVGALIVGEGSERPRIEALAAESGVRDYVVLAGQQRDVRPFLEQMDAFALTSIAVETFSNAALEAMAKGVPIVTSRIGGMEELIAFGGGLSYPPGDVPALVAVLEGLLSDEDRRRAMASAARRAVVDHFAWSRMVDGFERLLLPMSGPMSGPVNGPTPGPLTGR